MTQPEVDRRIIRNKAVAIAALCLTALCTAQDFRNVFFPSQYWPHWLVDLPFLPHWAAITINLFFYAYFLWIAVEFWRISEGKERFLLGSFGTAAFLSVIRNLLPISTVPYIRGASAAFMAMAFLAALTIFLNLLKRDTPMENDTQQRN
jgi:hypothetical protein